MIASKGAGKDERSCWDAMLAALKGRMAIVYGAAGAGKTSLALNVAKLLGGRLAYVNTEGEVNASRVLQVLGEEVYYEYAEARTLLDQVNLIIEAFSKGFDTLVIDSVNALYRLEVGSSPDTATALFALSLAISKASTHRGKTIIATAQVSAAEEAMPSGIGVISRYADVLVEISREETRTRGVRLAGTYFGRGLITSEGFRWLQCRT